MRQWRDNMKKIIVIVVLLCVAAMLFAGCNKDIIDTVYGFDRAIIRMPDGTILEGAVDGWSDFADGDQIQVRIGGVTYLVHSTNVVLIDE